MVKIGRCTSCGSNIREIWKEKENCDRCGGPVDHVEVDMGPVTYVPRALNIVGLLLVILGIILLIAAPAGRNGDGDGAVTTLILVISAVVLFVLSLLIQMMVFRKALEKRDSTMIKEKKVKDRARSEGERTRVARKLQRNR